MLVEQPAKIDPTIPPRVAVVCPRAFARAGLCRILDDEGFQVVWQGEDGSGLVAGLEGCSPDLILLGWKASGVDTALIESLTSSGVEAPIVVITTPDNGSDLSKALEAGAVGCLSCNLDVHDFMTALRMLADGDIVVSRDLVPAVSGAGNPERPENQLTPRELEVLRALGRGATNQEIARELHLSPNTVKIHVRQILTKMGFRNRQQASVYAAKEDTL